MRLTKSHMALLETVAPYDVVHLNDVSAIDFIPMVVRWKVTKFLRATGLPVLVTADIESDGEVRFDTRRFDSRDVWQMIFKEALPALAKEQLEPRNPVFDRKIGWQG